MARKKSPPRPLYKHKIRKPGKCSRCLEMVGPNRMRKMLKYIFCVPCHKIIWNSCDEQDAYPDIFRHGKNGFAAGG